MHFLGFFWNSVGKGKTAGTRGALAECPGGGLPEMIRGAAGRYPGGLRLGTGVALGDHPGKFHSLDSRRTRGFREVPMCLGTRGHVAHSESIRILSW